MYLDIHSHETKITTITQAIYMELSMDLGKNVLVFVGLHFFTIPKNNSQSHHINLSLLDSFLVILVN